MNLRIIPLLLVLFNIGTLLSQQPFYTVPRVADYVVLYERYKSTGFENSSQRTFSFNDQGNQTKREELNWTSSSQSWRSGGHEDYIYDAHDNRIEERRYVYFPDTETTENTSLTENTFDDEGNWLTSSSFSLDRFTGEKTPTSKTFFSYDEDNNRTEILYQWWQGEIDGWELRYRNVFIYDNGQKVTSIFSNHDGENYVLSSKNEHLYNDNGSLIEVSISDWNPSSEEWKNPSRRSNYTLDQNENLIFFSRSTYNGGQWNPNFKEEFVIDDDGDQVEFIRSRKFGTIWYLDYRRVTEYYEDHFEKAIQEFEWDDGTEDWEPTYRLTYTENSNLGVANLEKEINFFPNPVEDKIHISSTLDIIQIELYNSQGQLVKDVKLQDDFIDLDGLSSGFYILNVFSDKGKIVKKVLKK